MIPQLADYDYVIVNTSSGKDSQTILLQTVTQAQQEGFPKERILCAHADLGRMEWPGTLDLARQQARLHGVGFTSIARPQGDLLTHIRQRAMWPSSKTRYCTSDHKRGQIRKVFTQAVAQIQFRWQCEGKPQRRVRILNILGMRAEESPARAKLQLFAHDPAASNGKRHIDNWLAIHEWKLPDVWRSIKGSHVPYHKAYELGMPRLSCVFCIFKGLGFGCSSMRGTGLIRDSEALEAIKAARVIRRHDYLVLKAVLNWQIRHGHPGRYGKIWGAL